MTSFCSSLPLVLLPDFMLDETLRDDVIPHLGQKAVYRLGLAPGPTIETIADGIANAAPGRFILVGFSLGGFVAARWRNAIQAGLQPRS